jgi:hypothetical protein
VLGLSIAQLAFEPAEIWDRRVKSINDVEQHFLQVALGYIGHQSHPT